MTKGDMEPPTADAARRKTLTDAVSKAASSEKWVVVYQGANGERTVDLNGYSIDEVIAIGAVLQFRAISDTRFEIVSETSASESAEAQPKPSQSFQNQPERTLP